MEPKRRAAGLKQRLAQVDSSSKDALEELLASLSPKATTMRTLLACARDESRSRAATWLLKAFAEDGASFRERDVAHVSEAILEVEGAWSLLHLLQTVQFVGFDPAQSDVLWKHCVALTEHEHKFVRAWAYDVLSWIAAANTEHRESCITLLDQGASEEAASVRARVRKAHQRLL